MSSAEPTISWAIWVQISCTVCGARLFAESQTMMQALSPYLDASTTLDSESVRKIFSQFHRESTNKITSTVTMLATVVVALRFYISPRYVLNHRAVLSRSERGAQARYNIMLYIGPILVVVVPVENR
jgi:hypothetical protein